MRMSSYFLSTLPELKKMYQKDVCWGRIAYARPLR